MIKKAVISSLLIGSSLFADTNVEVEDPYHFYMEIGTTFGGDNIAENDDGGRGGDDYHAGGGAVLGAGIIIDIADNYKYQARTLVAYRYQGGDGSNSGVVVESLLAYRVLDSMTVGAGIHADFANKIKTVDDETIKFDDSIGGMFMLEWSSTPTMSLGAKYILSEYKSNSEVFDGNQLGVYLQIRY